MKSALALASLILLGACGGGEDEAHPPVKGEDAKAGLFALEPGDYFVERVWNLADGCQRNPLDPEDPITSVNYALTNDGKGNVSLERCVYEEKQAQGQIVSNQGTLAVSHSARRDSVGSAVAEYTQECTLNVRVVSNNTVEVQFLERQSGRNSTMKEVSGVDDDECSTSYTMTMRKR